MNLVVLAGDVDRVALKNVAKLTETREIEQITTRSFRLVGAKPHEALVATCAEGGLDHVWLPEGRQLSATVLQPVSCRIASEASKTKVASAR